MGGKGGGVVAFIQFQCFKEFLAIITSGFDLSVNKRIVCRWDYGDTWI